MGSNQRSAADEIRCMCDPHKKMFLAVFLHYCFTAISCQCSKVRAINVGDGADQAV